MSGATVPQRAHAAVGINPLSASMATKMVTVTKNKASKFGLAFL